MQTSRLGIPVGLFAVNYLKVLGDIVTPLYVMKKAVSSQDKANTDMLLDILLIFGLCGSYYQNYRFDQNTIFRHQ